MGWGWEMHTTVTTEKIESVAKWEVDIIEVWLYSIWEKD